VETPLFSRERHNRAVRGRVEPSRARGGGLRDHPIVAVYCARYRCFSASLAANDGVWSPWSTALRLPGVLTRDLAPPEALWSRSSTKIAVKRHHCRRRPRGLLIVDASRAAVAVARCITLRHRFLPSFPGARDVTAGRRAEVVARPGWPCFSGHSGGLSRPPRSQGHSSGAQLAARAPQDTPHPK